MGAGRCAFFVGDGNYPLRVDALRVSALGTGNGDSCGRLVYILFRNEH